MRVWSKAKRLSSVATTPCSDDARIRHTQAGFLNVRASSRSDGSALEGERLPPGSKPLSACGARRRRRMSRSGRMRNGCFRTSGAGKPTPSPGGCQPRKAQPACRHRLDNPVDERPMRRGGRRVPIISAPARRYDASATASAVRRCQSEGLRVNGFPLLQGIARPGRSRTDA